MNKVKYLTVFILFYIVMLASGCKLFATPIVAYENKIELSMVEEYKQYFPYELPSYVLEFEGTLNTTENRTGPYEVIFTQNDDFKVSEILRNLFEHNKDNLIVHLLDTDDEAETWMNTYEDGEPKKEYIKVLDNTIYNEIAYITLENGLILSVNYAKIIDWNNNVYYRWQVTESIRMILHYPLMVTDDNAGNTMFLLLPIPAGVTINFDPTTKDLQTILEKDKFKTDKSYYTYKYIDNWNKETVSEYYVNNFNGILDNNQIKIKYFDYDFVVTVNDDSFTIEHLK